MISRIKLVMALNTATFALLLFVGVASVHAQIPIIGQLLAPQCFIEYQGGTFRSVSCEGSSSNLPLVGPLSTPNFQAIWNSFGGGNLASGQCYRITDKSPGIEEQGLTSEACKKWIVSSNQQAATTPGGGTTGGGTTGGSTTPATTGTPSAGGSAPIDNNAKKADPTKPTITREGGFEEVDDKCNVGNQGKDCAVTDRLSSIADVLSVGVGVIVVIMIIVGGIQYTTAGSDPQKIATAKGHILNAIIALVAFFFLFAFLQWVVPGGIFL